MTTHDESTATRWARVTEIVDEASRRSDPRERDRYLQEVCGADEELRREVEGLLRFDRSDAATATM